MRTSFVVALLCGAALVASMIGYVSHRGKPPISSENVQQRPATESTYPGIPGEPVKKSLHSVVRTSDKAIEVSHSMSPSPPAPPENPIEPPPPASTPFTRAIDTLISAQANFQQKQAAWKELRDAGQLDQVIEALTRGAAENRMSAAYPAALGQAQLQKAGELSRNGGTISEMGILGMQADQNFDAALNLDPTCWEAQFFKAVAMSYWPLELNKGDEVIERLSRLIDQQETMAPQPQFAQTYIVLGDQYEKMGQTDYAIATWQIGAQRFPGNAAFRQKILDQ